MLKVEWNNEWLKYDDTFFNNNSEIINQLIKQKHKSNYDYIVKCSMIYDEFVESLNIFKSEFSHFIFSSL